MKKDGLVMIYARVSTIDGKQDYNRQIDELRIIILKEGYEENQIEIYKEKVSGYKKNDERPQLSLLLSRIRIEPQKYKCLYVSEITRIGRDPKTTREIVEELTDLGVPIYIQSINEFTIQNGNRNMVMNIILQVLIEYSNFESETFKTRSKSGLLKSVMDGKVGGGSYLPYGYKKGENKMLEIDNEESKVIEWIFQLYKEGNGIRVISNYLNEKSIPTRTKKSLVGKILKFKIPKSTSQILWTDKQIHDIIRNPIYMGKRRFKGELLSSPSIISEECFVLCNETLKSKNTRNITTTYTYLLKDLIKCGVCGRNYFGRYKPVPKGDKVYKCSSTLIKGGSCGNIGINIKFIESVFFDIIVDNQKLVEILVNTDDIKKQLTKRQQQVKFSISTDKRKLVEKQIEIDRLLDIYLKSSIDMTIFERKSQQYTKEVSNLNTKIENQTKDLSQIRKSLSKSKLKNPTTGIINESKTDRTKLWSIYKRLFNKIIINRIDQKSCFVTLFLGENLDGLFVNKKSIIILNLEDFRKMGNVMRYEIKMNLKNIIEYNEKNILISPLEEIHNDYVLKRTHWDEVKNQSIIEM